MAWVRLSDGGGSFEVTLFSEVLARAREILREGTALLVTADLRLEGEALRITAQDVAPLDQAAAGAGRRHARLADRDRGGRRISARCWRGRAGARAR